MAATHFEIQSFTWKFQELARIGRNANLNFNCSNGNIFVNFAAELGHVNVQDSPSLYVSNVRDFNLSQSSSSSNHRSDPKPSKIKRRKRREAQSNLTNVVNEISSSSTSQDVTDENSSIDHSNEPKADVSSKQVPIKCIRYEDG